jgi:PurA ssDNA and RNA-binding protein
MISNERPSAHGYRSYSAGPPKPPVNEDTLKTEKLQIERKTFIFTLKENPRGRFLRITEDVNGRRDNVIVPSTGLEEFKKVVDEMVKAALEIPVKEQ